MEALNRPVHIRLHLDCQEICNNLHVIWSIRWNQGQAIRLHQPAQDRGSKGESVRDSGSKISVCRRLNSQQVERTGVFVAVTAFLLLGIAGYVFLLGRIEPIPNPA